MKRTDLIALADELECLEREQADAVARSTIRSMVQFARQIAQAQPVGYLLKTGHGNRFAETIPPNMLELTWAGKPAWSAIYTLPLED